MKQESSPPRGHRGQDFLQCFPLLRRQRISRVLRFRKGASRRPQGFLLPKADQSPFLERFQRFARIPDRPGDFGDRQRRPFRQHPEDHLPLFAAVFSFRGFLGFLWGDGPFRHPDGLFPDPSAPHLGRNHQPKGFRQGAVVGDCHFLRQGHQLRQHRRIVLQRPDHRPDPRRIKIRLLLQGQNDALPAAGPEGNQHALAGRKRHPLRNTVGEGLGHVFVNDIHDHLAVHFAPPSGHTLTFYYTPEARLLASSGSAPAPLPAEPRPLSFPVVAGQKRRRRKPPAPEARDGLRTCSAAGRNCSQDPWKQTGSC